MASAISLHTGRIYCPRTFDAALRFMNLVITAVIPVVLFFHLSKSEDKELPYSESFITAIVCMLFPVLILMGTMAQPEPLFCLTVLLFGIYFSKEKYFLSSVFLTISALLRYEAWVLPPAIIFLVLWTAIFRKPGFLKKELQSVKPLISVLLPLTEMGVWTIARYYSEGIWLGFIFLPKDLLTMFSSQPVHLTADFLFCLRYLLLPLIVPYYLAGPIVIMAFFGIRRTLQRQKYSWVILYSVILLFLTLTWIKKSTLGLHRHFAVLVPFYSVLLINGIPYFSGLIFKIKKLFRHSELSAEDRFLKLKKYSRYCLSSHR